MFFVQSRLNFFKPLTSKYREQIVQCLCLMYQRLYSANADYGSSLAREQVLEIFEEALVRAPVIENQDEEDETRFKNVREQANWTLKQLLDSGWLERQVDNATMQSTYPFSRMGRLFTQPLVESDMKRVRTRHRNTRNTLNALEAFLNRGEVHDLLDAYEYSERIVTDFSDVISELEEKKRELVQELESQQLVQQATEQFFEFMEKRFQPDLSVRLSADSVEKHRDQIQKAVSKIRRKQTETKRQIELQLRQSVPELYQPGQSILWMILDAIEQRMSNAAEIMLPALRRALHSFTKRADIIIRQLSYLHSQQGSDILSACKTLSELEPQQAEQALALAGQALATVKLQLIDPAQIKLHERRQAKLVSTSISDNQSVDKEAQKEQFIQQLLDQAFSINQKHVRQYLRDALGQGQKILSSTLPIGSAHDLLAAAHIIEVGAINNLSSDFQFKVEATGRRISEHDYFLSADEFTIELITLNHA